MATIGRRNTLSIVRESAPGLYLNGGELGEILLVLKSPVGRYQHIKRLGGPPQQFAVLDGRPAFFLNRSY